MDGTILTGCTGPRWNGEKRYLTFGLPAGRRMPPRKRSRVRDLCGLGAILTTGPNRGRTSTAEIARERPKPTCAGPPGRARACRVLCGPMGSGAPALFFFYYYSSLLLGPFLAPPRRSPVHYSSRCSLPETATCAPLSLSLPPRSFFVSPVTFTIHAVSCLGPGCEDEVVPRTRSGRWRCPQWRE